MISFHQSIHLFFISGNNIGDDGVKFIFDALKVNSSLHTIDLRGVWEFIVHYAILTSLFVSNLDNNIGDDGARYISEVLKVNSSLNSISLGGMCFHYSRT